MFRLYCCSSRDHRNDDPVGAFYFLSQNEVTRTRKYILSGLFRGIILPFLKANGRTIASEAIKTGLEVANDVVEGKSFKESVKRRIPKGIDRVK